MFSLTPSAVTVIVASNVIVVSGADADAVFTARIAAGGWFLAAKQKTDATAAESFGFVRHPRQTRRRNTVTVRSKQTTNNTSGPRNTARSKPPKKNENDTRDHYSTARHGTALLSPLQWYFPVTKGVTACRLSQPAALARQGFLLARQRPQHRLPFGPTTPLRRTHPMGYCSWRDMESQKQASTFQ